MQADAGDADAVEDRSGQARTDLVHHPQSRKGVSRFCREGLKAIGSCLVRRLGHPAALRFAPKAVVYIDDVKVWSFDQ